MKAPEKDKDEQKMKRDSKKMWMFRDTSQKTGNIS